MHNIFEKNDIEHRVSSREKKENFLFFSATVVNNRRLDVWISTLMNIMQAFFLGYKPVYRLFSPCRFEPFDWAFTLLQ